MKITLKPDIYTNALFYEDNIYSMSDVKKRSGLNYATILKLCKGEFANQTFRVMGKYFSALGYKAADIQEMRVKEVFEVVD